MPIKHLAWLHRLHYYWCGGMRLLNAFNPNSDQANRGNGESLGRYLAITGDWTSYYDPFASQTCINPPEPSHSQPSAKPSVQAAGGKKSIPPNLVCLSTASNPPNETFTRVAPSRRFLCQVHCVELDFYQPPRQLNGPSCKHLKITALHSVMAIRVPSSILDTSGFGRHVMQSITWP